MIIEINYTALQWDNHQGGSGIPITRRFLREIDDESTLAEMRNFAYGEIELEAVRTKTVVGNYSLINIVIDKS